MTKVARPESNWFYVMTVNEHTDLHGDHPVVHHHLFGQEVSANCGLILVAELLIDILVHK